MVFIRIGAALARTSGELHFDRDIRLVIRERLVYNRLPMRIDWYGYEVWQGENKLYWYDSQPHPDALLLASTHPHHRHIHPNIKHHRIPAPEMSFTKPNLTVLIKGITELVHKLDKKNRPKKLF